MHLVITVAIAYAIMAYFDNRSIRKEQRRRQEAVERELAELARLEREDGEDAWLD
jgi:hypothetical protein